jgi:hypothetical protein
MGTNLRIAVAVGLGYLLGRRKKLRTAVTLGAAIAAGRLSRDPGALLQRGGDLLGGSPVLGQVAGLRKPLTEAGKAAAVGAVSRGIDSVGDRIRRRTDALRTGGGDQPDEPDETTDDQTTDDQATEETSPDETSDQYEQDSDEDSYYDEEEGEPEPEPEQVEEPPRRPRPPAARRPAAQGESGTGGRPRRPDPSGAPVRRRAAKP